MFSQGKLDNGRFAAVCVGKSPRQRKASFKVRIMRIGRSLYVSRTHVWECWYLVWLRLVLAGFARLIIGLARLVDVGMARLGTVSVVR